MNLVMRLTILAVLFATAAQLVNLNAARAQALPDGEGRDRVTSLCSTCHGTNLIGRSSGFTRAGWAALIGAMIDLSADAEDQAAILDYLTANFPPSENRASTRAPGDLAIDFEDWIVPTLGQRPRDPVEGPDGSIWWVGQWADILGRIEPKTGEMREFALPVGAKPHSVEIGPNGGVWYTGNKNATIGRLNPETHEITEFAMPDEAARDPHTHVFDADGILWFSLQRSNMIGRLDPRTGEIRTVRAPTPGSRPYGVKVASDGAVWVACNGSNCLLRLDPSSMEVSEIRLPEKGTTVRRHDIGPDGTIWWVNSGLGRIGSYDPRNGEIREWPSPSGPESHPYAIAYFDGAVWYNESGVRPDMLVRFDPGAETFQSWPIPSGDLFSGIVRHMRVSRDGMALLIHQTATNRIARVSISK